MLALASRPSYAQRMATATYADLEPDIDRALRFARETGGDVIGQAVAWLQEHHPGLTSSELMHWVILHRERHP